MLLNEDEVTKVFVNIEQLHAVNLALYTALCQRSATATLLSTDTATLLTAYCTDAKCYVAYVCGYDDGRALLADKRKANKELDYLLRVNDVCERCRLEDLLIQPVQRIPRYLLLLRSLLGQLSPTSVVHSAFTAAMSALSALASAINSSLHMHSSYQRVGVLASRILDPPFPLAQSHRYYICDGILTKKFAHNSIMKLQQWKRYWFILFNDCLLYTTVAADRTSTVKVKHVLFLDMMRVRAVDDAGTAKGSSSDSKSGGGEGRWVFEVKSSVKCVVCSCDTEEERDRWVSNLKEAIDVAMRDKLERRKDIEWSSHSGSVGSSSGGGGEVKRLSVPLSSGSGIGLGGLSVVETDDWEDEEDDSAAVLTPSPITPARRHTSPSPAALKASANAG